MTSVVLVRPEPGIVLVTPTPDVVLVTTSAVPPVVVITPPPVPPTVIIASPIAGGGGGTQLPGVVECKDASTVLGYTPLTAGMVFVDAAGGEIFRLWGNDPDLNQWASGCLYIGTAAGPHDPANTGYLNTGIGALVHQHIVGGSYNTALGAAAMQESVEAYANEAFGDFALYMCEGRYNSAFGGTSLSYLTTGYENTTCGSGGLNFLSTGFYNTAVGSSAGSGYSPEVARDRTRGLPQPLIGNGGSVIDTRTVFIGAYSGRDAAVLNTVALDNAIAIGFTAFVGASNAAVVGNAAVTDVYFGSMLGTAHIHAQLNQVLCKDAATGAYSLANSGIVFKTAAGAEIYRIWGTDPNYLGAYNSANLYIGFEAGKNQPLPSNGGSGYSNTGIGAQVMKDITSGGVNTGAGAFSLWKNTTGRGNTACGYNTLGEMLTGQWNTGVGAYAGMNNNADGKSQTDDYMVYVGYLAGKLSATKLTNSTAIGANSQVTQSNTVVIGDAKVTDVYFGSTAALATLNAASLVCGSLWVTGSIISFGGASFVGPLSATTLTLSGQSVAGSASALLMDISTTWNTSGSPIAIGLNVINTASAAAARLLDLRVANVSKMSVDVAGTVRSTTLALAGQSLTGAQTQPLLDLATSWNTTGVPTAIKLNVTNTASGAGARFIDVQDAGISVFRVINADGAKNTQLLLTNPLGGQTIWFETRNASNGSPAIGSNSNLSLYAPSGAVMITDGANSNRDLYLRSLFASGQNLTGSAVGSVLDLAATWNTTGSPTAIKLNVTNTLSGAGSRWLDIQHGGASQLVVGPVGSAATFSVPAGNNIDFVAGYGQIRLAGYVAFHCGGSIGSITHYFDYHGDVYVTQNARLLWTNQNSISGVVDTGIAKNAPGVIEINNGTAGVLADLKARNLNTYYTNGSPSCLINNLGNLTLYDFGNGYNAYFQAANAWRADAAGVACVGDGLHLGSNRGLMWAQSAAWYDTIDTALMRNAAGVVEVNSGTAGQFRDLKARTIISGPATPSDGGFTGTDGNAVLRGTVFFYTSSYDCRHYFDYLGTIQVGQAGSLRWTNNNGATVGSVDTSIWKAGPGVLEITNGLPYTDAGIGIGAGGLLRDLRLRSIIYATPTVDATATGPTTSDFNCGYTSSVIGEAVYLDAAFTWQKADATTKYDGLLAIVLEVKSAGQPMRVALPGSIIYCSAKYAALTNAPLYLSETTGLLTAVKPVTPSAANRVMGWGVHANKLYFFPSPDYITRK
jgi:hypothetical protein